MSFKLGFSLLLGQTYSLIGTVFSLSAVVYAFYNVAISTEVIGFKAIGALLTGLILQIIGGICFLLGMLRFVYLFISTDCNALQAKSD